MHLHGTWINNECVFVCLLFGLSFQASDVWSNDEKAWTLHSKLDLRMVVTSGLK